MHRKFKFAGSSFVTLMLPTIALVLLSRLARADDSKLVATSGGEAAPIANELAAKFNRAAEAALGEMNRQAERRKMRGAAAVAFIPGDKTTGWISHMRVVGAFVLGNSNVLGVAYTKAAEMADTLQNSGGGSRSPYKGEFGFKGGVIEKRADGYLLAVFSGGKAEDDIAVSQAGLKELGKAMDAGAGGK